MVHIVPASRLTNRLQTDSRAGRTLVIHTERKTVWIAARERGRAEARPLSCGHLHVCRNPSMLLVARQRYALSRLVVSKRGCSLPYLFGAHRRRSVPSHRRSYPRCRIGGNLTKALFDRVSLRVVYLRGATSHILILSLLNLRDELIIQPCPHPPSARRCSLARGRQPARDT